MDTYISKPREDFKVNCSYCGKVMRLLGREGQIKKHWARQGMATAASLKDTRYPLYLCPDKECGGIHVVKAWVVGGNLKPGLIKAKSMGGKE